MPSKMGSNRTDFRFLQEIIVLANRFRLTRSRRACSLRMKGGGFADGKAVQCLSKEAPWADRIDGLQFLI